MEIRSNGSSPHPLSYHSPESDFEEKKQTPLHGEQFTLKTFAINQVSILFDERTALDSEEDFAGSHGAGSSSQRHERAFTVAVESGWSSSGRPRASLVLRAGDGDDEGTQDDKRQRDRPTFGPFCLSASGGRRLLARRPADPEPTVPRTSDRRARAAARGARQMRVPARAARRSRIRGEEAARG